jgi:GAF domain
MPVKSEQSKLPSALDFASLEELKTALTASLEETSRKQPVCSEYGVSVADWQLPQHTQPEIEVELSRLRDLLSFGVLDSTKEGAFDSLTEDIRERFGASWAVISFVDLGRHWLKSYAEHTNAPLEHMDAGTECLRRQSFCAHTILQDGILTVPDAAKDERFCENPAVTGEQHLRFYAGAPLITPNGNKIGALAIMANQPRPEGLSADEENLLNQQASSVMELLVKRRDELEASHSLRKRSSSKVNGNCKTEHNGSEPPTAVVENNGNQTNNWHITPSPSSSSLASLTDSNEIDASSVAVVGRVVENSGKRSRASSPSPPSSRNLEDSIIQSPRSHLQVLFPSPKTEGVDPDEYLLQLVQVLQPGLVLKIKTSKSLGDYFPVITEEQMARYGTQVVNLARTNDVDGLKAFFRDNGRVALECYNRFGEGLLNLSCRRGFTEMTQFLLSAEVNLDVRRRDDYGRTCLHDTCWNPEPLLDICTWIMQKDPSLFLVADDRGFTPFQYARKSDWNVWRQFLYDRREYLEPLTHPEIVSKFS